MNIDKSPILNNVSIALADPSNLDFLNRLRKDSGKRISAMSTPACFTTRGAPVTASIKEIYADFTQHTFDLYINNEGCQQEIDIIAKAVVHTLKSSNRDDFNIFSL